LQFLADISADYVVLIGDMGNKNKNKKFNQNQYIFISNKRTLPQLNKI